MQQCWKTWEPMWHGDLNAEENPSSLSDMIQRTMRHAMCTKI